MAYHRGGAKKPWVVKGRKPKRKMYQEHCRKQFLDQKLPTAKGQWEDRSIFERYTDPKVVTSFASVTHNWTGCNKGGKAKVYA